MKKAVLLVFLFLLTGVMGAQTAVPKPAAPGTGTAQTVTDETKLKISDTPQTTGAAATAQNTNDISIWNFLGMLLMLGAVIALIYGFIFFLKKLSGQQSAATGTMKVLNIQVLNGNKALYLVDVAGEVLLVGTGDGGVNLIKEIKEKETIDTIRLAQGTLPGVKKKGFGDILQSLLGKKEPSPGVKVEESVVEGTEFLKKQRDRLKNL